MLPLTADDVKTCMINMSDAELETMSMPGLHETLWDEREFLGWRDVNHNTKGYLVFWIGDQPRGLMVRAADTQMPAGKSAICALCHTQQPAPQVSLFVAPKAGEPGKRGNTVGTYMCADLACSTLIRITPPESAEIPDPSQSVRRKSEGMRERLESFSNRVLQVDA
ncbi:MAG: hypothetical protein RL247_81 [Actinomycetota bacterium]